MCKSYRTRTMESDLSFTSDSSFDRAASGSDLNMVVKLKATEFTKQLRAMQSDAELRKHQRYFKFDPDRQPKDDYFIGVRMGNVFELGKQYSDMPVDEIEKLMESPVHEIRAGAMSIMGQCAKGKGC